MALLKRLAGFVHTFRQGPGRHLKATLAHLWSVYSKPAPECAKEVMTLLFLCSMITVVTAFLIFRWMSEILKYDQMSSSIAAGLYAAAAFPLLSLVHPLRCAFTVILPTLGTKQGRKLILSTAMMLLVLNVIPSIAANMGVVVRVLKCTAEGMAQSLINSSELVNRAKEELIEQMKSTDNGIVPMLREFSQDTNINVTEVKQRFEVLSHRIENDFSHATHIIKHAKLVANRLVAVFFVIYLFAESALYLNAYLTNVKFDNKYVTGELFRIARENGIQLVPDDLKNMVFSTSCRISKEELLKCILRFAAVTLYFIATVFIVVLDYVVYDLLQQGRPWITNMPTISISIGVNYKVTSYFVPGCIASKPCKETSSQLVNFQRTYSWSFGFGAEGCVSEASPPDSGVTATLLLLYLLAYAMVLLEVYAGRARRKVSASFFPKQERKRTESLFKKILAKQEKQRNGVFFIDIHRSGFSKPGTPGLRHM
ncbi:hypothetical protein AGOR_G00079540 [Albula goreensis]|uniref:Dendritic cell-specific transmembrane protein-like domain-containing protein n=1 Tax=Albula goreensis TaxID=1534307 RepID=A0A8T3DLU3_9TELE|nr:hypothetical protein AGOR_G00079540 [Albula goreensis]